MPESKYAKFIAYEGKPNPRPPPPRQKENPPPLPDAKPKVTHMMFMDSEVIEGAFYSECAWFWPGAAGGGGGSHTHPFDEVVAFIGTNPDDVHDLGGEVEFWIEDEKFMLTKSFLIFIPGGVKHCPLYVRRADRPIFHFTLGPGKTYG